MNPSDPGRNDGRILEDWADQVLDDYARRSEQMTDAELAEANLLDIATELLETNTLADGFLIAHPDDPEYLYKLTLWVAEEGYESEYGARVVAKMEELRRSAG